MFYDDKSKSVVKAGKSLIIYEVEETEEVVFKASFVIANNLSCAGKVIALFDLIVIGDIECDSLDVKGKLICIGNCNVKDTMIVQNEIWANDITAKKVVCHDRIVAQGMDVENVKADGNIVIGKTLAIEDRAETIQNILCGETAYGAGKLVANTIVTVEPLDLDDGEEALENPFMFKLENTGSKIAEDIQKFVDENNYMGYLKLLNQVEGDGNKDKFDRAQRVFTTMNYSYPGNISEVRDVAMVLWLIEMSKSNYFSMWNQVNLWLVAMVEHFDNLLHGRKSTEDKPMPTSTMEEGYVVSHFKFGRGVVTDIRQEGNSKYITIEFDEYGEKKFTIPQCLEFFKILSVKQGVTASEIRNSLKCEIAGYDEWLTALTILNSNKAVLGEDLYNAIYDMLLSQIGLKVKFIQDRLREKGWE